MNFKSWMENEASLGSGTPEMGAMSVTNRGSETNASDAVKQSGLQPQVDSQEIETKSGIEQDAILAIDSEIEHMDMQIPAGDDADSPKINQFKQMWEELKAAWNNIKMANDTPPPESGFGTDMGDPKYLQMMQQNPNMVPGNDRGQIGGPGTFGQQ